MEDCNVLRIVNATNQDQLDAGIPTHAVLQRPCLDNRTIYEFSQITDWTENGTVTVIEPPIADNDYTHPVLLRIGELPDGVVGFTETIDPDTGAARITLNF
jgi:hypothetical protein